MLVLGGIFFVVVGGLGLAIVNRFRTRPQDGTWGKLPFSRLVAGREEYYLRVQMLASIFFIAAGIVMLIISATSCR